MGAWPEQPLDFSIEIASGVCSNIGVIIPSRMYLSDSHDRLLPPRWVIFAVFLTGLLWLVFELRELFVLLIVSYSIAYIVDPVVSAIQVRGVSRANAIFLFFTILFLAIIAVFSSAVGSITSEATSLINNLPVYVESARDRAIPLLGRLQAKFPGFNLEGLLQYVNGESVRKLLTGLYSTLMGGYSIALTILNLALLPFVVFYFALDFRRMHEGLLGLFPMTKQHKVREIAAEINQFVSAYVRGQLLVGAILAVLYSTGLFIIGVDFWLLLGLISGFGNLIPYVGFVVGILLSSIMALVTYGDFSHLLQVWALYAGVQALEGTVITPKIVGSKVGLSPLIIMLALVIGGNLFGLIGIFLAVPVAAVVRVLGRHFREWLFN